MDIPCCANCQKLLEIASSEAALSPSRCPVCLGCSCTETSSKLVSVVGQALQADRFNVTSFNVSLQVSMDHPEANRHDLQFLCQNKIISSAESQCGKMSRVQYDRQIHSKLNEKVASAYKWVPVSPDNISFSVELKSSPIFIGGRYCKYSRNLHQTPWKVADKCSVTSVEEQICANIVKECKADGYVFSAAGREDVDVRMLGTGRPFVVQVNNPRVRDLPQWPICQDVKVLHWSSVSADDSTQMKLGEQEKKKTYSALCYSNEPIYTHKQQIREKFKNFGSIVLDQKTPVRVLHRRAPATRKRTVSQLKIGFPCNDARYISVGMVTEAGTYVKEFVSGDFGRTRPSLWELLETPAPLVILELDVSHVDLQWPPKQ